MFPRRMTYLVGNWPYRQRQTAEGELLVLQLLRSRIGHGKGCLRSVHTPPAKSSSVLFNGAHLGFADYDPRTVARNPFEGAFDKEPGFGASEFVPPTLAGWNELGGQSEAR
jgi:hypothetical protein